VTSEGEVEKTIRILLVVMATMLFLAVLPIWPYGFYTLMRLLISGVCAYAVIKSQNFPVFLQHKALLIILAILFNPLVPVHLDRSIWLPIDIFSGGYFIYLIMLLRKRCS